MKAYEQKGLIRVKGSLTVKKQRPFGANDEKFYWNFRSENDLYTETTSKPTFDTKAAAIKNAKRYGIHRAEK